MIRLRTLKAKGCRGILDGPDLEFGKDGVVLVGDNGTGKSSYIDALEKVLTGKCGSLDTGDQGLSWARQGKHVASKSAPQIELVLSDGSKDFSVTQDGPSGPANIHVGAMLSAARRQSFLLRRRTLLAFINAKPADRYKAVADFLQLERFNALESKLRALSTQCQGQITGQKTAKQVEEIALRQQLGISLPALIDTETCLAQLNKILGKAGLAILDDLESASIRMEQVEVQLAPFSKMEEFQKVQLLKTLISELPPLDQLREVESAYHVARKKTQDEEAKLRGNFYQQVLEEGVKWIQADSLETCPLCESTIDPTKILQRVEARLNEHATLTAFRDDQDLARAKFVSALRALYDALVLLRRKWTEGLRTNFPDAAESLIELLDQLVARHSTLQGREVIEDDSEALSEANPNSVARGLSAQVEAKLQTYPSSERYEVLTKAKSTLHAITINWNRLNGAQTEISRLETARSQIQRIVELAEKARKEAVQQLLDQIATHADRYFQNVHPGENIGSPALKVTDRGTASIDLTCVFHKKSGDPRGCYSEGHVDSLGLCIFLAIRRFHHSHDSDLSLLVLDDVLHSVDGEHRMATAKLILKEFSDHQIVITTHDPLWFENLKAVASAAARTFSYHRIAGWSLTTGPVWGDHLSDYEWLTSDESLTAMPADRVIKAGRLLEQMLQHLCDGLSVPVPFSLRGRYTLDPLWTSFLPKAKKNKEFYAAAGPQLDKIEELRGLRNLVGAHYNEWANYLTANESKELTDAIVTLRDRVYCPKCNEFIKRIAGLEGVWSCKGEHLRFKA